MTMPRYMNCEHDKNGWCLDCVNKIHNEKDELERFKMDVIAGCDIDKGKQGLFRQCKVVLGHGKTQDKYRSEFLTVALQELCDAQDQMKCSSDYLPGDRNTRLQEARDQAKWILGGGIPMSDDDHHTMMNGPRVRQSLGLEPSIPRTPIFIESFPDPDANMSDGNPADYGD